MQYPPDNYQHKLQGAYDQFRKEYTLGKGAGREEVERAFRDKMKRQQETIIKPEVKIGGHKRYYS